MKGTELSMSAPMSKARLGVILAMLPVTTLFGTLITSLFLLKVYAGKTWDGKIHVDAWYPTLATLAILLSSYFFHSAEKFKSTQSEIFKKFWKQGSFFALSYFLFVIVSFYQLFQQGHTFTSHIFYSMFYSLCGLHLFHALIMLPFIWKAHNPELKNTEFSGLTALFWHFLGAIWCVLFVILVILK